MTGILRAEGLAKAFAGVRAVRDVSFEVRRGEMLALIGPNGAGKSTCFNMLNGQIRPDAGRVLLDGADLTGRGPRTAWRRGVARTFQVTETFPTMTVRENVQMVFMSRAGAHLGMWRPARSQHVTAAQGLLRQVGMDAQAERPCGVLAYGDVKRLELAMALASEPKVLLMDEPTAGMAPTERMALMALTAGLARERGLAVLFTEHSMDVVFGHAHRVLVLSRGAIVAQGTPQEVRDDPVVQEVYLGSGNLVSTLRTPS